MIEKRRAFTPAEVDDMELWVIAELLWVDAAPAAAGGGMTEEQFRAQADALNQRRIEHAAATKAAIESGTEPPPPLAAPPSATPAVTDDMIAALAARRREREAQRQGA